MRRTQNVNQARFKSSTGTSQGGWLGNRCWYSVGEQVTEGTSALFLLTGSVTLDKVEEEMKGQIGTLIKSNLTHEQEAKLNAGFGEE